jgi:hypothetical protein
MARDRKSGARVNQDPPAVVRSAETSPGEAEAEASGFRGGTCTSVGQPFGHMSHVPPASRSSKTILSKQTGHSFVSFMESGVRNVITILRARQGGHAIIREYEPGRGVAQPGSAPALGAGGRQFESGRPDQ